MARLTISDLPSPPPGLAYRLAGVEAAAELNGFHNRVHGTERSLELCRWKFFDPALGENRVGLAVEEKSERIVAAHPGIVRRLYVDGTEHRVYQIADVAVDPEYRRGIALYRSFVLWVQYRGVLEDGILFGYGGQISETHRKVGERLVGYRNLLVLPVVERRLSLGPAVGRHAGAVAGRLSGGVTRRLARGRYGGASPWDLRPAVFDHRYDALWARLAPRYRVALVRDAAVLAWRYGRNPAGPLLALEAVADGELRGYVVARLWEQDGCLLATVLDLQVIGGDADATLLLDRCCAEAAETGVDFLRVALPPAGPLAAAVAAGSGWRQAPQAEDHVICKVLPPDPAAHGAGELAPLLENGSAWCYSQGDSDYLE